MSTQKNVSEQQLQTQFTYIDAVARLNGGKCPKAYTHTFGCQQNEADTERIRGMLHEMGYEMTDSTEEADFILFNTCAVREHAEDRAFGNIGALSHLKKKRPDVVIALCGCMAQRDGEKLLADTDARLILGTARRAEIVTLLEQAQREHTRLCAVTDVRRAAFEPLLITHQEGRTRATLKIQEGCDRFCTYCIIPYVRGGIRSRSVQDVRDEAARLEQAGYREIVLTGIHLTSYGRDLKNGDTLLSVIRAVHDIAGVERIRLGSLEPVIATADFARALGEMPKLCPQFHLALQSGCDSVLRRMRRRYDTAAFRESAQALRAVFPDCALTTDVMSGFPGETDAEHRQSLDFCREMRFARMHVFPYSEREGTAAATMPDPVPRHIREERARELIALGAGMAEDYRRAQLGTVRRVLFEQCAEGVSVGYTPEYMRCETLGTVCGQTLPVRMTGLLPEGFSGEIVTD